jgi:hypothetical protein
VVTDVVSTCLHCCHHQGHASTIGTLSYAIRFWSKGTKRALFLRHEGFLLVSVLSLLRASMFGLIVDWRIQRFHRGMDQAGGICASQLMKSWAKAVFFWMVEGSLILDDVSLEHAEQLPRSADHGSTRDRSTAVGFRNRVARSEKLCASLTRGRHWLCHDCLTRLFAVSPPSS